jgi:broad specificity phosphatase PhoE
MRIFLVRHGQTAWNSLGLAQGHTDIPLDELGLRQASALAAGFSDVRVGRVISSDLARAAQTAEPLAKQQGVRLEKSSLLRERCFGEWEGKAYSDISEEFCTIMKRDSIESIDVMAPGGGESFRQVWDRLDGIVADLCDAQQSVAVVTHGGTGSVLLARLLDANLSSHRAFRHSNGSITELSRRPDGFFRLVRYNDTRHLDGVALKVDSAAANFA